MPKHGELEGEVVHVGQTEEKGASGFKVRQCVVRIDANSKYPQEIPVQYTGERCGLLDTVTPGEVVSMPYELRGREYNGRWYVNVQSWEIEVLSAPAPAEEPPPFDVGASGEADAGDDSGLPF